MPAGLASDRPPDDTARMDFDDLPGTEPGLVLAQANHGAEWRMFRRPAGIVRADRLADAGAAWDEAAAACDKGYYAAGFIAYDATPAFDPAMEAHPPTTEGPLVWFALYTSYSVVDAPRRFRNPFRIELPDWTASMSAAEHEAAVVRIRECIAQGEVYQVNLTHRLTAPAPDDPLALFWALYRNQRGRHGVYADTGDTIVASASPELLLELAGDQIVTRPMKGTAPRAPDAEEDEARAAALRSSPKERAENVMIVDMARHDFGRIALTGSVETTALCEIERYPSVWQMVSTVRARTRAPLRDIVRAVVPAASITGAPKIQATRVIARVESGPRGVYTGCAGWMAPGRRAEFNVAIRTVHIDRRSNLASFGTGGGIVWDSTPAAEFDEGRTKALVLVDDAAPFDLIETCLWSPRRGVHRLALHRERLIRSAGYFNIPLDDAAVWESVASSARTWPPVPHRVRLLVNETGNPRIEAVPFDCRARRRPWRIAVSARPVDSSDRFLRHKTTRRETYDAALAAHPGFDDVILRNERGEITESCRANIVARIDGRWLTPAATCGLLRGVMRESLLRRGILHEAILAADALARADRVLLINSLRGWIPATIVNLP